MIRMPMGHALFSKQAQEPSWLYSPAEGAGYAPQRQCRPPRFERAPARLSGSPSWNWRAGSVECLCGTTRVQAEAGSRPG
jgi:hypothetical protein